MSDIDYAVVANRVVMAITDHYQSKKNLHKSFHESIISDYSEDPLGFYSNRVRGSLMHMISVEKEIEQIEIAFQGISENKISIPEGEEKDWINTIGDQIQERVNSYATALNCQSGDPLSAAAHCESVKAWALIQKLFQNSLQAALS